MKKYYPYLFWLCRTTLKEIYIFDVPEVQALPLDYMPCACGDESCAILEISKMFRKPTIKYVPGVFYRFEIDGNFSQFINTYKIIIKKRMLKFKNIVPLKQNFKQLISRHPKTTIIIGSVILAGAGIGKIYQAIKKRKSTDSISDETISENKNLEEKTIPLDSVDTLNSTDDEICSDDIESEVENEDFQ